MRMLPITSTQLAYSSQPQRYQSQCPSRSQVYTNYYLRNIMSGPNHLSTYLFIITCLKKVVVHPCYDTKNTK